MSVESICIKCGNYDPLGGLCSLSHDMTAAMSANKCDGFIRYMNLIVQPASDLRRHIMVSTKRGIERAVPAYEGIDLGAKQNDKGMVERIFTYQGQREIIHEYGARIGAEMAAKKNIELHILPHEVDAPGNPNKIRSYYEQKRVTADKSLYWMSDTPVEVWT
ncbi:hypothetical protein [Paenibacillus sp. Y412MC10]|uniref:hypothetical protein n=1 Tax=Geobacillus sp. (strain Y412MC10) TaxID=481743 RepID=UPI0011AB3D7E|nr:hypothetical protein [Paenibacillus sp. Y412MC10]